jgi:hypothetical protein
MSGTKKQEYTKLSDEELEAIKSLEESIQKLHSNVKFGANAFKGNVEQVEKLMDRTSESLTADVAGLKKLSETYRLNLKGLDDQIATLSLLPSETLESLKKLVPEIGKEVETIHNQRMQEIEAALSGFNKDLRENTESDVKVLKDTSEEMRNSFATETQKQLEALGSFSNELIKKFNQNALEQQKSLERIINGNMERIRETHSQQIKQQVDLFNQVADHTIKEVKSVTSNNGSKFFRNTAICLILAAITGCASGWYVNRYMPKFVTLERSGNVAIYHSNVKVLEAPRLKKNDPTAKISK